MNTSLAGKKAPAFSLAGSDGRTHAPEDYAGETVVMFFYPRDNTPGCTKEACGFRDHYEQLRRRGVRVFGVSGDSLTSHDKFIGDHNLTFVLLSDPETTMMQAYHAWGEKSMYGKKFMGVIRSTVIIGPDGKIIKHWEKVSDAAVHPDEVMACLASLNP